MADTPTNLLSQEDLEFIGRWGAAPDIRRDLVAITTEDDVVFSLKGIQFYSKACSRFSIDIRISSIKTVTHLLRIHQLLIQARSAELLEKIQSEAASGVMDPQFLELTGEVQHGSLKSVRSAICRFRQFSLAGKNVVGINFARKTADSSAA